MFDVQSLVGKPLKFAEMTLTAEDIKYEVIGDFVTHDYVPGRVRLFTKNNIVTIVKVEK